MRSCDVVVMLSQCKQNVTQMQPSSVRRSHPKGYNLHNRATQSPTNRQGFRDLSEVCVRSTHHDVRSSTVGQVQEVGPCREARDVQRASTSLANHMAVDRQKCPTMFMCAVDRPHDCPAHRGVGVHTDLRRFGGELRDGAGFWAHRETGAPKASSPPHTVKQATLLVPDVNPPRGRDFGFGPTHPATPTLRCPTSTPWRRRWW